MNPLSCEPAGPELAAGLDQIRDEFDVPGPHSTAALEEADQPARRVLEHLDAPTAGCPPELDASVVAVNGDRSTVVVASLAVQADIEGVSLPLGETVRVRVDDADPASRQVRFTPV
jgi:hypothetical protein